MDGSIFRDLYRGLFWLMVVGALVTGGTCFGVGYACNGCKYRPHFEMRKATPESPR